MIWSVQILLDRSRAELYGVDVGPNCRTDLVQTAEWIWSKLPNGIDGWERFLI